MISEGALIFLSSPIHLLAVKPPSLYSQPAVCGGGGSKPVSGCKIYRKMVYLDSARIPAFRHSAFVMGLALLRGQTSILAARESAKKGRVPTSGG